MVSNLPGRARCRPAEERRTPTGPGVRTANLPARNRRTVNGCGRVPSVWSRNSRARNSRSPNRREPNDRGAGTVAALGICLVLLGSSMVALVLVQASVAAVRAATAADLAALAGADALRGLQHPAAGGPPAGGIPGAGSGGTPDAAQDAAPRAAPGAAPGVSAGADACRVATEVAARNNASLRACTVDPGSGTLTVETEVGVPALPIPAVARARAGPPG